MVWVFLQIRVRVRGRGGDVGIILIKLWHYRSALGTITSSFLSLSMSHQKKKYFNFISFSIPISK